MNCENAHTLTFWTLAAGTLSVSFLASAPASASSSGFGSGFASASVLVSIYSYPYAICAVCMSLHLNLYISVVFWKSNLLGLPSASKHV